MSEPSNNTEAAGAEETTVQLQPYTDWSNQQPQMAAPEVAAQHAVLAPAPAPEPDHAVAAPQKAPPPEAVQAELEVQPAPPDEDEEESTQNVAETPAPVAESNADDDEQQQSQSEPPQEEAAPPPPPKKAEQEKSSIITNGRTVGEGAFKKTLRKRSEKVVYVKAESDAGSDTVELHFSEFNTSKRKKRGARGRARKTTLRTDPKKTERLIMENQGKKVPGKKSIGLKPNYNSPRYSYRGLRGHYNSYTQIERLEIGRQALMNGHMATAKKFGIHESTVRDFRMKLEKHVASGRLSLTVPFEEQDLPPLGKRGRPTKPKKPKPPRPRDEHGKIRRGHYKIYTQKERLEIGRHAIIHGSGATIKKYGIHESTVRDFRKKLEAYVGAGLVSLTVPLEEQVLPPIGRRGRKRDPNKIRAPKTEKRRRRRKKKEVPPQSENQELSMADVALRQMQNNWPPQWPAQFAPPPGHHMPPTSHPVETHQMIPPGNQLPTQLPIPGQLPPHLAQSHQMIPPASSQQQQIPPSSHNSGPFLEFLGLPPPQQHAPPQPQPTPPPQHHHPPPPQPTPPPPAQSPHPSVVSLPTSPGPSTGRSSIPPPQVISPPPQAVPLSDNPEQMSIDRNFVAETLQSDNLGMLTLQNRSRKSLDKAILTILQARRKRNRAKNLKMIQPETNRRKREMDQCKVSLGTQDTRKRWVMLKDDLGFDTHEELAMHLMDLHAALCMPACNKFGEHEELDKHYPPIEPKPKETPLTPEQIVQREKQKERQLKVQKQRQVLKQQLIEQEALQKKIKEKLGGQVEQVQAPEATPVQPSPQPVNTRAPEEQPHQVNNVEQQQYEVSQEQLQQQQEQLRQQEHFRQEQLRQQEEHLRQQQELQHQAELGQQEELRRQEELHRQQEELRRQEIQHQQVAQMVIPEQLRQGTQSPYPATSQPHISREAEHQQTHTIQLQAQEHQVQEAAQEAARLHIQSSSAAAQQVQEAARLHIQSSSAAHQVQEAARLHIQSSSAAQQVQEAAQEAARLHIQSTSAAHQVYTSSPGQEQQQQPLIISRDETQPHVISLTSARPTYTSTVQVQQSPLMATRQSPLIQLPRPDQQAPLIIHTQGQPLVLVTRPEQQATLMSPMSPRAEQPVYTVESQESQPHIATLARHAIPSFPVSVTHVMAIPLDRQDQPQYMISASPHPQEAIRYVPAPAPAVATEQQQEQQQQLKQQQKLEQQQQQLEQQQPTPQPQQPAMTVQQPQQQQQYPVSGEDQQQFTTQSVMINSD